jgi:glycosyltransferase involved in cell wall biosynthesis
MTRPFLHVAIPWSLSHYIPLDGFHPLYRALFDHAPGNIKLSAWDNVELYRKFRADASVRKATVEKVKEYAASSRRVDESSVATRYEEYFWPPDRVLTAELEGDIEFHHTAPFPSLKRPFVFHCESFASIFFPFAQQGSGNVENYEELREHYRSIFAHHLCLGVFSHVPETLHALSAFLSDTTIDRKLFPSRIGLSGDTFPRHEPNQKLSLSRPRFLFVNSANQNSVNFFRRGGHLVLRFWKEFAAGGRDGLLMLRCAMPGDIELCEHGVDVSWVKGEIGRSIVWDQGYLAGHEMQSLMASAHFFLLPSADLHSVSIMEAMRAGAIPVVPDTVGTSVCVTDEENGIILSGVRKEVRPKEEGTDLLSDQYSRWAELDNLLVEQMISRVCTLLEEEGAYWNIHRRTLSHAKERFSGQSFAQDFWISVSDLYAQFGPALAAGEAGSNRQDRSLNKCTIQSGGWSRVFESPPQPMLRIRTEFGTVWELGGAMIQTYGKPRIDLNDWSVLAQYYKPSAPPGTYAYTLEELEGKYLHPLGGCREGVRRKLVRWVSKTLRPFPVLYRYAAQVLAVYRRHGGLRFIRPKAEPTVELVRHDVTGYNIIRHRDRYYAILQREGEFSPEKVEAGGYSSCYFGHSVEEVLRHITASIPVTTSLTSDEDDGFGPVHDSPDSIEVSRRGTR